MITARILVNYYEEESPIINRNRTPKGKGSIQIFYDRPNITTEPLKLQLILLRLYLLLLGFKLVAGALASLAFVGVAIGAGLI